MISSSISALFRNTTRSASRTLSTALAADLLSGPPRVGNNFSKFTVMIFGKYYCNFGHRPLIFSIISFQYRNFIGNRD